MKEEVKATVEPDILRDRVFVVSLINVLTDAFGSAKDLYHRLKQKSNSGDEYEQSRDNKHEPDRDRRDSHSNLSEGLGRHIRWSLDRRARHHIDSEDELVCTASSQVQTTYDRGYKGLGEPYAQGDDIAKIQLQSHIIKLQQVLISIHQDLMLSNYLTISSSHSQLIRLTQTVRTARAAAIQALNLQYERMLSQPTKEKPKTQLPIPGAFLLPPRTKPRSRSSSSSSSSSDTSVRPPPKPIPIPNPNANKLFCRYALDLQTFTRLPLSHTFELDGTRRCPSCRIHVPVRPNKAWEVIAESKGHHPKRKKFLIRNRFVVKCHRASGGFACVLCAKYADADMVCRSIGALMEHMWKEHPSEDFERDEDIVDC